MVQLKRIKREPMYKYLMMLTIASMVGLQTWRILFNNFAVEIIHLQGNHVGMIQTFREIPGFLALLAIFVMMFMKEHRLSALSIVILGLGVASTGFFPSYTGLLITTLVMSFGFHYFETTNQSLTLQYFEQDSAPWVLGKLRSYAAISNIGVGIIIFIVSSALNYKQIYLVTGFIIMLIGAWGWLQNPANTNIVPQRRSMVFRRKYWLFYVLTFLGGARRQIFMTFAVFLLVSKFKFSIKEITVLFVINNILGYIVNPLIGKAIIKFGERRVLSLEYFGLIIIFLGYAYVNSRIIMAGLYIMDHVLFNFSMAVRTYFQKVGDPRDISPSMAMGFTINHVAAVIIPVVGGALWMLDYRIPFIGGAILGLVSLLIAQVIPSTMEHTPRTT